MPFYRLPNHLSFCDVGETSLVLDLRRDRYFSLAPSLRRALERVGAAAGEAEESAAANRLAELGLIIPSAAPATIAPVRLPVPPLSLLDSAAPARGAVRLLPLLASAMFRARRLVRRRGLEAAVEAVRWNRRIRGSVPKTERLAETAAAFRAARRLVPAPPHCLLDSLTLSFILSRRGLAADLVFGVKLDPFAAHCWLQTPDFIVNDSTDLVEAFTPILVV